VDDWQGYFETIDKVKNLPPAAGGVVFFRKLSSNGYKMIIMSYSPGVFANSWISANGLEAGVICPDFVMSNNVIRTISTDRVTEIYLNKPKDAKAIVLENMDVRPDICVGNNKQRDGICNMFVDIRTIEPQYKHLIRQVLHNLDKFL
jgi:hypothetical protein